LTKETLRLEARVIGDRALGRRRALAFDHVRKRRLLATTTQRTGAVAT
jgi:hypothetical protein